MIENNNNKNIIIYIFDNKFSVDCLYDNPPYAMIKNNEEVRSRHIPDSTGERWLPPDRVWAGRRRSNLTARTNRFLESRRKSQWNM